MNGLDEIQVILEEMISTPTDNPAAATKLRLLATQALLEVYIHRDANRISHEKSLLPRHR